MESEIEEIYGVIKNFTHPYIEAEDFGSAIIKFKNGSIALVEGSANVYPKNLEETLSIFGETGTVVIGGLAVNKIKYWIPRRGWASIKTPILILFTEAVISHYARLL